MLTGPELGKAIADAIQLKNVPKTAVAKHFGIKGPSIYDWIHHGRVGKQHLNELVAYFSDVVGPEHWGLLPMAQSQFLRLDAETISRALLRVRQASKLALGEPLDVERDPELLAAAIRVEIASQLESLEGGGDGLESRSGKVGRIDSAAGSAEDGRSGQSKSGKQRRKTA